MHRRLPLLGFAVVVACSSGAVESSEYKEQNLVLRVSTHFWITPMGPGPRQGVTAYLQELVYDHLNQHCDIVSVDGNVATLRLRSDSALSPRQLLDALEHPLLVAKKLDGDVVVAEFSDVTLLEDRARNAMVNAGRYQQSSVSDSRMTLRRRRRHQGAPGPSVIEAIKFESQQEEWRRFLAGDVDVVLYAGPSSAKQLATVPSVRTLSFSEGTAVAIYFNMRSPRLNKDLRQVVSLALRREALAEYAAGNRDLAAEFPENLDRAQRTLQEKQLGHGLTLRLLVFTSSTEMRRAALAIQHQLTVIGIDVIVQPVAIDQVIKTTAAGDYDLFVFFGDLGRRRVSYLRTGSSANIVKYSNPKFDLALANKDWDRCLEIVRDDLPMTPLFRLPMFFAVDRKFCGAHPLAMHDPSWLADAYLCAPGETE